VIQQEGWSQNYASKDKSEFTEAISLNGQNILFALKENVIHWCSKPEDLNMESNSHRFGLPTNNPHQHCRQEEAAPHLHTENQQEQSLRSPTLIGLDILLTTLISIAGKTKQLLTCTQKINKSKACRVQPSSVWTSYWQPSSVLPARGSSSSPAHRKSIRAKVEWLRSARLIQGDQKITTRHAKALNKTKYSCAY
jgi:hypothetical protein